MGAGKTTVGRALARRLGWSFEDLDDRIELLQGRSIQQIFRDSGEAEFRRAEAEALRQLLSEVSSAPQVVALGGGAFAQPDNAAALKNDGAVVVFLDGSAEELFRRCERELRKRPLHGNPEAFRELYERRRPAYLQAGWRIDTSGKDQEMVAAEIVRSLELA